MWTAKTPSWTGAGQYGGGKGQKRCNRVIRWSHRRNAPLAVISARAAEFGDTPMGDGTQGRRGASRHSLNREAEKVKTKRTLMGAAIVSIFAHYRWI